MAPKKPENVQQPRPLERGLIRVGQGNLMDRVVSILDQARANVARAVNSNMVIAYWLIGREIVEALQSGEDRAEYGQGLLNDLSEQLGKRYGQGFSITNLRHFRLFYQAFSDREPAIHHSASDELATLAKDAVFVDMKTALETTDKVKGFSPNLSWTHYRTLCKVEHRAERRFYEIEAEKSGWSVSVLERQIHSLVFARLLKSRDKAGVLALAEQGQTVSQPIDVIKHPYVLDFLDCRTRHDYANPIWKRPSSNTCNRFFWNWAKASLSSHVSTAWRRNRNISSSTWCFTTTYSNASF